MSQKMIAGSKKKRSRIDKIERRVARLAKRLRAGNGGGESRSASAPAAPGFTAHRLHGLHVLIPPNDFNQEIVTTGDYEPHVTGRFMRSIKATDTVLDVGANIGTFTLLACAAGAKSVIAIELSAGNCKFIAANCRLNGFEDRVTILPMAAAREFGMMAFPATAVSLKMLGHNSVNVHNMETLDVAMSAPLDSVVGDRRIDVMKLDIDGWEYTALLGATRILDQRPLVFLEYAPWAQLRHSAVNGADLLKLFFDRGYECTVLGWDRREERLGQDQAAIDERFRQVAQAGITHIDLMLEPKAP